MSIVDEILRDIPTDQLAAQLGTDERTAEAAARNAIPALLAGMQNNAGDPDGEMSLAQALSQHESSALANDGMIDLNDVDTRDGQKIVQHVFGSNEPQVVNTLAGHQGLGGGMGGGLIQKLLPILAPIVLAYLARRMGGQGGLLGSILGGMLGGGGMGGLGGGQYQRQDQGGLGGMFPGQQGGMGGMFPGQQGGMGGGGLADVLGGMLGGVFGGGNNLGASGSASIDTSGSGFDPSASGSASVGQDDSMSFPTSNQMGGPNQMGGSPFNTPEIDGSQMGGGQPQTMDIGEDSAPIQADGQSGQQPASGGGLMDALNSILRGGR